MSILDPMYPQQPRVGTDSNPFKMPTNCLFNPIYLTNPIKSSVTVTINKKYRPDLACQDLDYSSKYIKVVNIINGKPKGIFSYDVGETIYAPDPDSILTSVSQYEILSPPKIIETLPFDIVPTFQETVTKFNDMVKTSVSNVLYMYLMKTSQDTLTATLENSVKNLYEGILP